MRLVRDLALLLLVAGAAALAILSAPALVRGACHQVAPDHPDVLAGYNPSRWRDCTIYGLGDASVWSGPGIARNDCLYPWTGCTVIAITSLETGITIVRRPTMFCDCYTRVHAGPYTERIVDLDRAALLDLGLNPDDGRGLYPVDVRAASNQLPLPDTAMNGGRP